MTTSQLELEAKINLIGVIIMYVRHLLTSVTAAALLLGYTAGTTSSSGANTNAASNLFTPSFYSKVEVINLRRRVSLLGGLTAKIGENKMIHAKGVTLMVL